MRTILTFLYSLLTLAGCMDGPGTTLVARTTVNGVDTLFSKTRVAADSARFECIDSASGHCHYALFANSCTGAATAAGTAASACSTVPAGTLVLATGQSRELAGLPADFRQCVSADARPMSADCVPQPRMARAQ